MHVVNIVVNIIVSSFFPALIHRLTATSVVATMVSSGAQDGDVHQGISRIAVLLVTVNPSPKCVA